MKDANLLLNHPLYSEIQRWIIHLKMPRQRETLYNFKTEKKSRFYRLSTEVGVSVETLKLWQNKCCQHYSVKEKNTVSCILQLNSNNYKVSALLGFFKYLII